MRPVVQRYADRGFRGTAPAADARSPVLVSDTDFRLTARGMAAAVTSFLRCPQPDEALVQADPSSWPTALSEYIVPDLVLMKPGPYMTVSWNRVIIYPTSNPAPGDGFYYVYRTDDDPPEQRIRLGRQPDPGDIVRTEWYWVDFTA